ncbi:MAG TPA: hypothetical protein VGM51_17895 [Armatimonadota bacterium]|jgi:hypothetical protein
MAVFENTMEKAGRSFGAASTEQRIIPRRRSRRGIGFWLDWAPMIGLGLAIAVSGVHCIGASLFGNPPAMIAQTNRAGHSVKTAQAPDSSTGIPVAVRIAF